jgi:hypothetical protein
MTMVPGEVFEVGATVSTILRMERSCALVRAGIEALLDELLVGA